MGEIYNGHYFTAAGFLVNSFVDVQLGIGALYGESWTGLDSDNESIIGAVMIVSGYVLSVIVTNCSAKKIDELSNKKINATKLKKYQQKDASTSLNYIPHEG